MIRNAGPALCAVALILCACSGESEDEVIHPSEQGTVTTSGSGEDATTRIDTADGTTVVAGAGAEAAVSGPVFARPYPGSRVVSAVDAPNANAGLVTFETDANPETILAYYRERAQEAGFGGSAVMNVGDTRQFAASNEAGGQFNVTIAPNGEVSTVTVAWEEPN